MNKRGLIAAGVAALLIIGLLLVWNPFGSKKNTITAYFPDAAGLFVGNDVGILGVPVGKVTAVKPEGNTVKVTLEVPADQAVPADADAVIVARSVATDRYVELTPAYSTGDKMGDNAVIPLVDPVTHKQRTAAPVDFDDVLKSINVLATGLSDTPEARDAVKKLVDSADAALSGKGTLLNTTVTGLAGATDVLRNQSSNVTGLVTALDSVVKVINANRGTTNQFIHQVSSASQLLADQRQNFHTTLVALNKVVGDIAQFDRDNRDLINANLKDSTKLMQVVLARQNKVADILRTFPVALRNLQSAVNNQGQLRVRLDPAYIAPLGNQLSGLCQTIGTLCQTIDGTSLIAKLLGL